GGRGGGEEDRLGWTSGERHPPGGLDRHGGAVLVEGSAYACSRPAPAAEHRGQVGVPQPVPGEVSGVGHDSCTGCRELGHATPSNRAAMPWPPPTHIVSRP